MHPAFYAVWNRQDEARLSSSSGGVFRVLAEDVLADGGVVYGAAFDVHNRLRHVRAESADALVPLTGSKYVQSEIGTAFCQVRADLKTGAGFCLPEHLARWPVCMPFWAAMMPIC